MFNRLVDQIYLLNFIPENALVNQLNEFWAEKVRVKIFDISSPDQLSEVRSEILKANHYNGILIQLLAHGDTERAGFGDRSTAVILWSQFAPWLREINISIGHSLIIDASMTCLSDPIARLKLADPEVYHAAIFTPQVRSTQALIHTKEIFAAWLKGDDITVSISQVNDKLLDAQGIIYYGYIGG